MNSSSTVGEGGSVQGRWPRLASGALLACLAVLATWLLRDKLSLTVIAGYDGQLRQFQREHAQLVLLVAFAVYVVVTGLSIPAATILSLLYGWYFGFWPAVVVVSFGSTSGATLAFLASRYCFRDYIRQRFASRLERWNERLMREGPYYLFTLRLVPIPFFLVNAVMGVTPIPVRTFWWVSQLGMLPATMVYVYAGSVAPGLKELSENGVGSLPAFRIAVALLLLGLLPIGTRTLIRRFTGRSTARE